MTEYWKSKIYVIKRRDTNEIIWTGGTVSNLSRRYWNHKCNHKDEFHNIVKSKNLDWRNLKIELVKDYYSCRDRKTLKFASDVISVYITLGQEEVLNRFLENIDYYVG